MPARLLRRAWAARKGRGRVDRRSSIGCGVDVVELSAFRRAMLRGGEAFLRRVFTPHEAAYAKARKRTMLLHLAGRFAAKEAVIKAISQLDPAEVPRMREIEIRNDRLGRPSIVLHNRRRTGSERPTIELHVSLSHVDSVAVASALALGVAARRTAHGRLWRRT